MKLVQVNNKYGLQPAMKPVQVNNMYNNNRYNKNLFTASSPQSLAEPAMKPFQVNNKYRYSLQSSVTGTTSHETGSGKQQVPVQPPVLSHWQNQP